MENTFREFVAFEFSSSGIKRLATFQKSLSSLFKEGSGIEFHTFFVPLVEPEVIHLKEPPWTDDCLQQMPPFHEPLYFDRLSFLKAGSATEVSLLIKPSSKLSAYRNEFLALLKRAGFPRLPSEPFVPRVPLFRLTFEGAPPSLPPISIPSGSFVPEFTTSFVSVETEEEGLVLMPRCSIQ